MRVSLVVNLVAAFFVFGTAMCLFTLVLLEFPGTFLDRLWRVNPEAHYAFARMGVWAFVVMVVVGTACALSALGLALRREWGRGIAIAVLTANLIGDTVSAIARDDPRTLIGLPVGGAMLLFLASRRVRAIFIQR